MRCFLFFWRRFFFLAERTAVFFSVAIRSRLRIDDGWRVVAQISALRAVATYQVPGTNERASYKKRVFLISLVFFFRKPSCLCPARALCNAPKENLVSHCLLGRVRRANGDVHWQGHGSAQQRSRFTLYAPFKEGPAPRAKMSAMYAPRRLTDQTAVRC